MTDICKSCGKGRLGDESSCTKCRQPFAGQMIVFDKPPPGGWTEADCVPPPPSARPPRPAKPPKDREVASPSRREGRAAALAAATAAKLPQKPKQKRIHAVAAAKPRVNVVASPAVIPPADAPPPILTDPEAWAEATAVAAPLITREQWMLQGVEAIRPMFEAAGEPLPERVRVSTGWPGGRGKKEGVVGQCWMPESTADGIVGIFVSPVTSDPVDVLGTLVHELVHAVGHRGHKGKFATLAGKVGLIKPWTSTPLGEPLKLALADMAERLGAYDHAVIKPGVRLSVQSTRMLKLECSEDGYTVRTTRKWIEVGLPSCPDGHEMVEA